jgi:hypothetical protein
VTIATARRRRYRALLAALAVAMVAGALSACLTRIVSSRRLTGTCDGACAHYLACKAERTERAEAACIADCQQVFSDADSLRAFESLSCEDAVEYVDGAGGTRHASDGPDPSNASSQAP